MSIGQTLHNLFGGGNSQSAQSPTPQPSPTSQMNQNPGATPAASTSATSANGMVPGNPDGSPNTGAAPTPMADFSKLWETKATDGNANTSLFANIDPQKVQEAAGKVNFAQTIGSETFAKIQAGGPEAAQAFVDAMNKVSQTVYAQSAVATTQLIDRALAEQATRFEAKLPELVRKQNVSEGLKGENPIFSNPALAPVVGMIQNQLSGQFPNASAAELKQMTVKYFTEMTGAMAPAPKQSKSNTKGKDDGFDWDAFANS